MKIKNIIGLGLVVTCSFSAFAQKEEKLEKQLEKAPEILVGTWDQECDNEESLFIFNDNKSFKLKTEKKNTNGTWRINKNNKLVLDFNKKDTEKWTFTQLSKKKFTITKGDKTCMAAKRS